MKKFLTLVLALVLALGLAAPAMAFTSDDAESVKRPYELSIYLVEYDDNDFFGITALPESDRGYAKNEIVAAVVELYVPKNEKVADDYNKLILGGKNVKLNVTDNDKSSTAADYQLLNVNVTTAGTYDTFTLNSDNDELSRPIATGNFAPTKNTTYKWLYFAKVTDDDASLYAKLVDGSGNAGFTGNVLTVTLAGDPYTVTKAKADGAAGTYTIVVGGTGDYAGAEIIIYVDKNYKSKGMAIEPKGSNTEFSLGVDTKGVLGVIDPDNSAKFLSTTNADYEKVMDTYEDVVIDVFGLDYFNIGNYVRDSFFKDMSSGHNIVATVDIEPWTAYVSVPDNIVVDPPKTGDAASIVGFVMVALAGGSAVALKKRG